MFQHPSQIFLVIPDQGTQILSSLGNDGGLRLPRVLPPMVADLTGRYTFLGDLFTTPETFLLRQLDDTDRPSFF